jgi:hypothetical protein
MSKFGLDAKYPPKGHETICGSYNRLYGKSRACLQEGPKVPLEKKEKQLSSTFILVKEWNQVTVPTCSPGKEN